MYNDPVSFRWRKLAALVLLLIAAADVSVMGICQDEIPRLDGIGGGVAVSAASNQENCPAEDGCFCCCTHVIPARHVKLAVSLIEQRESTAVTERQPQVFLPTPPHPPRS